MNIPREVQSFIRQITPDDVGVDTVKTPMGDFVIHYEGFSDQCNYGHDDDSIHKIYQDVYRDFDLSLIHI